MGWLSQQQRNIIFFIKRWRIFYLDQYGPLPVHTLPAAPPSYIPHTKVKLQGFHDRLKQEFDIVEGYDTEASVAFIEVRCRG